ncbi:MAG: translation initiation factor translation initiation factor [Candidatus Parcubacteria bacterium]
MSTKSAQNSLVTTRPPVVVIMGHIDHGKSTLLDYIRKSNIVDGEAGGITQHLGAYEVTHTFTDANTGKKKTGILTFLDTPGHEAFCSIRERGARVADIAILVVSAEDGVKPQTLEALKCIRAEKIPFIVAMNKIDKPGANVERTKTTLAENEIYLEGYGGDIPGVAISALNGQGIPELLDTVMLVADLADLKGNASEAAAGAVIEANLDNKKGVSATLLIKNGTLTTGMFVVADDAISPVRILEDYKGAAIKTATFSSPVRVIGFNKIPTVGTSFVSFEKKRDAEDYAANFTAQQLSKKSAIAKNPSQQVAGVPGAVPEFSTLPIIIKADVTGSLDGIKHELAKITHDKVHIKIVTEGIGVVSETDVKTAQSDPNMIIIAFNAKPDSKARAILERTAVRIESFNIIYNLIEFMRNEVAIRIPKEYIEETTGRAKILAIFSKNKDRQIIGGKVQEGTIVQGADVKIIRRDAVIGSGKIKELQQQKAKTAEVAMGFEFGALIESKIELTEGDKFECFKTVEKK